MRSPKSFERSRIGLVSPKSACLRSWRVARQDERKQTPGSRSVCLRTPDGRECPDDLIHARIKLRQCQRFLEKRQRTAVPAHGLILLDAFPLRVHRHFRAIETAMKRRRDKTRRLTDKFIGHTNEEIDEPLLVGRLNCKDFYQSNHFHPHDDLPIVCPNPTSNTPDGRDGNERSDPSRANLCCNADTPLLPGYKPAAAACMDDRIKPRHGGSPSPWKGPHVRLDFEQRSAR